MGISHKVVTLSFSVTALGSCSYHRSFNSIPNSLQYFQCMCAAALLRQRMYSDLGFLLDGEDPPKKVGCRKKSYFLEFMNIDFARDFVGVVFHVLVDGAKGSHNH